MKTMQLAAVAALILGMAAEAAISVTNVTATQRYPWDGKVDIDYEVICDDPAADVWVYAMGFDKDTHVSMAVRAISGDGANASVKPGRHRMTWDVTSDYPGFNSSAFTVKMTALVGGAFYMVVDLSGGVDAISYPVSYLSSVPVGGWTDEYKTDKLVLRLIPPGTFMMGSPPDELGHNESWFPPTLHQVTLTKPFYIGVFELTQKQWFNVMGTEKPVSASGYTTKGDTHPAQGVSYDEIRGAGNGAAWPTHNQVDADSFMGRLRSKTNMMFDLPTEAQWEYACRAGTETALNSGKNLTAIGNYRCPNLDEVAWYYPRSGNRSTWCGRFRENAWGLYDMHGNAWEWCLDWVLNDLGSSAQTDPKGPSSSSSGYRSVRSGGCVWGYPQHCLSASRGGGDPHSGGDVGGFRVACHPAD